MKINLILQDLLFSARRKELLIAFDSQLNKVSPLIHMFSIDNGQQVTLMNFVITTYLRGKTFKHKTSKETEAADIFLTCKFLQGLDK